MSTINVLMMVQCGQKWQVWGCDFIALIDEPCWADEDMDAIDKWITQHGSLVAQTGSQEDAKWFCDLFCVLYPVEWGWSFPNHNEHGNPNTP